MSLAEELVVEETTSPEERLFCHLFNHHHPLDTFPSLSNAVALLSVDSLVLVWADAPRSLGRKARVFSQLSCLLNAEQLNAAVDAICMHVQSRMSSDSLQCRLSPQSVSFLLLALDALEEAQPITRDLSRTLVSLLGSLDFPVASRLKLQNLRPHITRLLTEGSLRLDLSTLRVLWFADPSAMSHLVGPFGKWCAELKGLPDTVCELLPFLAPFLDNVLADQDFAALLERTSRRNALLAAALLAQSSQSPHFNATLALHAATLVVLVQTDNDAVQHSLAVVAAKAAVSGDWIAPLVALLKSSSVPRTRELVARFLAALLPGKDTSCVEAVSDFGELCVRDLTADATLTALVTCAAIMQSPSLPAFLSMHLKSSQRLAVRAAVLHGLIRSECFVFDDVLIRELCTSAIAKEATQPATPQATVFFVSLFAALADATTIHSPDPLVLHETCNALSKATGGAVLCDRGWAAMDERLATIWLTKVVGPVLFHGRLPVLLSHAAASAAWFTVRGPRFALPLILRVAAPLSSDSASLLATSLERLLGDVPAEDAVAQRVWRVLARCVDSATLPSSQLALLCHGRALRGVGAGSWSELVRRCCRDVDALAMAHLNILIPTISDSRSAAFYLLESLVALAPSAVVARLAPDVRIDTALAAVEQVSSAHWDVFHGTAPTGKPRPGKSTADKRPDCDASVVKAAIHGNLAALRTSLVIVRAVALAVPFHAVFVPLRSEVLCRLLLFAITRPDLHPLLLSDLTDALQAIGAEALDGRGPLLLSLAMDDQSGTGSLLAVQAAQSMAPSEFSLVALVFAQILQRGAPVDDTTMRALLHLLQQRVAVAETVNCACIMRLVFALLGCMERVPGASFIGLATSLLSDLGELPGLAVTDEEMRQLDQLIRRNPASLQLAALSFLASLAAPLCLSPALQRTVWLLHFAPIAESEDCSDAVPAADTSAMAGELLALMHHDTAPEFTPPTLDSLLGELAQLETESEAGRSLHVRSMQEPYIAAVASLLTDVSAFSAIHAVYARLLETRAVPTGIVRLTKNADRAALDFTRDTRRALLRAIATATAPDTLPVTLPFAFAHAFADPHEANCELLFGALLAAVTRDESASGISDSLVALLQEHLARASSDRSRVYAVVLLGRAASSRPALDAASRWDLITRILETLNVPSEGVQRVVADTLVPLLQPLAADRRVAELVAALSQRLATAREEYGPLRGAAYGLAAVLAAGGTHFIRTHHLFDQWRAALARISDKTGEAAVCAVLATLEAVSRLCRVAFEPYIPPLVAGVLEALGDSRPRVRADAESCADAMMSVLSPLSVSLVLPPLLATAGMESNSPRYSWRAKLGAVTWLGSMAHLAPKVLTPALPRIIPALIVALADAHERIHLAAHHALAVKYAAIIRSPEIKAALPAILRALSDPPKYAAACLGDIIGTSFFHAVDGPSLALLEPLLSRALCERGTGAMTEAKRRAIRIIANLGALMDPVDLSPYMSNLIPALRCVLGDPVPQVRSGAARALGALTRLLHVNGIVSASLEAVIPDCLATIFSPSLSVSPIDRAGAAQAIAQVVASRGLDPLVLLIDTHVAPVMFPKDASVVTDSAVGSMTNGNKARDASINARHAASSATLEALLHLLAALPGAVDKSHMASLYARVFTPAHLFSILGATAVEDEGIRETATRTIRALILRQALLIDLDAAMELLLRGTGDPRWRARHVAFAILSDLLPVLRVVADSVAPAVCDTETRTLAAATRHRVLARLYLGRFDESGAIRNTAFALWKSTVTHPPRVILEILPVLVDDCILRLAAAGDSTESATGALHDMLSKLADRVLLPIARRLVQSGAQRGALLAAAILVQTVIGPILTPPHLRTGNDVVVAVPRPLIDDALLLVQQCMCAGLAAEDSAVVSAAVRLLDDIAVSLAPAPVILDRILLSLVEEKEAAETADRQASLIAILTRRPRIMLPTLAAQFRKTPVFSSEAVAWWTSVLRAAGAALAPHVMPLLTHLLQRHGTTVDAVPVPLVDALLAAPAQFNPEDAHGAALLDQVEASLFSLAQFLETLWSGRDEPALAALLLERLVASRTEGPVFGLDRFYDVWIERLVVAVAEERAAVFVRALTGLVDAAVMRDESALVIDQVTHVITTRSVFMRHIERVDSDVLVVLVRRLALPVLATGDVYCAAEASLLLRTLLAPASVPTRIASIAPALLGALIRALSTTTAGVAPSQQLRVNLLVVLVQFMRVSPSSVRPFHPQLARLALNLLRDLIAGTENLDDEIVLLVCQLAALLAASMTRVSAFLDELANAMRSGDSRAQLMLLFVISDVIDGMEEVAQDAIDAPSPVVEFVRSTLRESSSQSSAVKEATARAIQAASAKRLLDAQT